MDRTHLQAADSTWRQFEFWTRISPMMTGGLMLGGILFIACAIAGARHALYIPAVVLLAAGLAQAVL